MKERLLNYTFILGLSLLGSHTMVAQEIREGLPTIEAAPISWGPTLDIRLKADLHTLRLSSEEAVELIPLLVGERDTLELPRMLVMGKVRSLLYERKGMPVIHTQENATPDYAHIVRHRPKVPEVIEYHTQTLTQPWMDGAQLVVVTDRCGCGWKTLLHQSQVLAQATAPKYQPQLTFIVPPREEVKVREKSGQAFLDFPVNQTAIHPDYRNNPRELAKIQETIRTVEEDPYCTLTAVSIQGFASPEGRYAANAKLAEGRAKSLLDYVSARHDIKNVKKQVTSVPEDWAGLDSLVRHSDIPEKETILSIIRDASITDPDRRDAQLKRLAGGVPYRTLLQEYYPALRHSDYKVEYFIRNFTVEEAERLIHTDPRQLSLEEMYRVAERYEPGSEAYNEVFEIAVRMYPSDPISNLNAANAALLRQDAKAAKRYLLKAKQGPEKAQAEQALRELEDYLRKKL